MEPRLGTLGVKLVFAVLAAVASVPLSLLTGRLLERYGLPNPGVYVWGLLHPQPRPGFLGPDLGSLLGTEIIINSGCWFVLLCMAASIVAQLRKRRRAGLNDTLPPK